MRVMASLFSLAVLLAVAPAAAAQRSLESVTAQAPISLEDAVPAMPEMSLDEERQAITLPTGWRLIEIIPGGFLLRHEDGSRARILQCQQSTYYRVAWRIDYERDGVSHVSANIIRQRSQTSEVGAISLRVRVQTECVDDQDGEVSVRTDGECLAQATAIIASWPERIQRQLLEQLNPATRTGAPVRR